MNKESILKLVVFVFATIFWVFKLVTRDCNDLIYHTCGAVLCAMLLGYFINEAINLK